MAKEKTIDVYIENDILSLLNDKETTRNLENSFGSKVAYTITPKVRGDRDKKKKKTWKV